MRVPLKEPQSYVFICGKRFRILVAGRRFGKTFLALVELIRAAWGPGRIVWYVAPTYKQAKRIAWKMLKRLTQPHWASKPNETDLSIELKCGGVIALRGADNYDSLRGEGLDFIVLDEYASMPPEAWTQVLRPSLADKQGRALFIGTPRGLNHFYDLFQFAESEDADAWAAFKFTTAEGGNVPLEELEQAAHELDERTYRQEFQASFENIGEGRVYYGFDRAQNARQVVYDRRHPIFWSLDFNVNPMCSVLGQRVDNVVHTLEEIILPNSNTWEACEQFKRQTEPWVRECRPLNVYVYGDATGEGRHSSADQTDWQIVREFFRRHADLYRAQVRVRKENPSVKARVNAMNALLCNYHGERRLLVAPQCRNLIKDFDRVCWSGDAHGNLLGNIDKSDPMRSHVSDALGYFVAQEFALLTNTPNIRLV